jgi:hypothetical protein
VIVRGDSLERRMSRYLVDRIERHGSIHVLTRSTVSKARGDDWLSQVVISGPAGEAELDIEGLFILIGADRSLRQPVSTVSLPFSSDPIEGKADRAVAPSWPLSGSCTGPAVLPRHHPADRPSEPATPESGDCARLRPRYLGVVRERPVERSRSSRAC